MGITEFIEDQRLKREKLKAFTEKEKFDREIANERAMIEHEQKVSKIRQSASLTKEEKILIERRRERQAAILDRRKQKLKSASKFAAKAGAAIGRFLSEGDRKPRRRKTKRKRQR